MRIALSRIDQNPHRDLVRNPLEPDQVKGVRASINRTGFWENVVVREHPEHAGRYQLAYGHNRLAALRENGDEFAEFIVKPLSDYDMLVAMIDENATQRNQTVRIVFENITAALRLGERLLAMVENVDDFNRLAKPSHCSDPNNGSKSVTHWRDEDFSRAKESIASGEGLGRGFVQHFLPDGVRYTPETIQNAIDSYYSESRKAAAQRKAQEAAAEAKRLEREAAEAKSKAEAQAKAEAEARARADAERAARQRAEAEFRAAQDEAARIKAQEEAAIRAKAEAKANAEAKARAAEAKAQAKAHADKTAKAEKAKQDEAKATKKAEDIDIRGFDRDLLERLATASHMQEIVQLARAEKIPSEYHAQLIDACVNEGWTTGGGRSNQVPHTILSAGRAWWYKASGKAERDRKAAERDNLRWKNREKSLDDFVRDTVTGIKQLIKSLDAIKPYADQIENQTLVAAFDAHLGAIVSVSAAVRENLAKPDNVVTMDLKRLEAQS